MPEALETWNEDLFRLKLPRIYQIICEINRRFCAELWTAYPGDWDRISRMAVVAYDQMNSMGEPVGRRLAHGERRLEAAFRDPEKDDIPRLLQAHARKVHERHERHRSPPLALLLESSADRAHRRVHRRHMAQAAGAARVLREIRGRRLGSPAYREDKAREQGQLRDLHRGEDGHKARPGFRIRRADKAYARSTRDSF